MNITRSAIAEMQAAQFRGIAVGRLEAVRQAVIAVQERARRDGENILVPVDIWECLVAVTSTLPDEPETPIEAKETRDA